MANEAVRVLQNELLLRKKRNPHFSLRAFAKWLNISPAQLSQMLTGKRTITVKTLKKITDRLDYSPIERTDIMLKLTASENEAGADSQKMQMLEDQFQIISDWYHFAILSLTKIKGASPDPRWIASRLGISVEDAQQALARLQRLGVIELKPKFRQICDPIEVISDVPSAAIRKYHKEALGLAQEKLETVPLNKRNFESITIPVNSKQIGFLKKQMDHLINLALKQSNEDVQKNNSDEVYQLNIQLFPLTKVRE